MQSAGEAALRALGDRERLSWGAEAALRSRPRRAPGELGRVGGVRLWAWGLGLDTRFWAGAGVCAGGAGWV